MDAERREPSGGAKEDAQAGKREPLDGLRLLPDEPTVMEAPKRATVIEDAKNEVTGKAPLSCGRYLSCHTGAANCAASFARCRISLQAVSNPASAVL
jgi:hypothetical protein